MSTAATAVAEEDKKSTRRQQNKTAAAATPQQQALQINERHVLEYFVITFGGAALSFASGFVNGVTYLGVTSAGGKEVSFTTSHMTGTTTVCGIELSKRNEEQFVIRLCILISFVFGAGLAGLLTNSQTPTFEISPEYGFCFLVLSTLLLLACVIAFVDDTSYLYYYLCSMAMGYQNALTSKYSGSLIRTTHVTGALTDIGLISGQYFRGSTAQLWKLPVLCCLVVSFFLGSMTSNFAITSYHKQALIIIVVFYFAIGLSVPIFISLTKQQPLWRSILGVWETSKEKTKFVADTITVKTREAVKKIHNVTFSPITSVHVFQKSTHVSKDQAALAASGIEAGGKRGDNDDDEDDDKELL